MSAWLTGIRDGTRSVSSLEAASSADAECGPVSYEFSLPHLGLILERFPEGVMVIDAAGTIRWANEAAREMTGWTLRELHGMRFDELFFRDELAKIAQARGLEDVQTLERYHCFVQTKSGQRREVSVSMSRATGMVATPTILLLRDIGSQREFEQRLLEKLTEKGDVEAFGRAAVPMVHDLRNLGNVLSLTIQNLEQHLDDPDFRHDLMRTLANVADRIRDFSNVLDREFVRADREDKPIAAVPNA